MTAASSDFAFVTLSPLRFPHLTPGRGARLRSSRVLRHARILQEYKLPSAGSIECELLSGEGQVCRVSRLVAFEWWKHHCNDLSAPFCHSSSAALEHVRIMQGFPSGAEMHAMATHTCIDWRPCSSCIRHCTYGTTMGTIAETITACATMRPMRVNGRMIVVTLNLQGRGRRDCAAGCVLFPTVLLSSPPHLSLRHASSSRSPSRCALCAGSQCHETAGNRRGDCR